MGDTVSLRQLGREDAPKLLDINRACPIVADFTLCFDRGPDFFRWPELLYTKYYYIGVYHGDRLVGYSMAGEAPGWTGREHGSIFYVGDARVLPEARGQRLAERALVKATSLLGEHVKLGFGIVKRGNKPAEATAAQGYSSRFETKSVGPLEVMNLILLKRAGQPSGFVVRRARADDLDSMAKLYESALRGRLFAPLYSADDLERDGDRIPGLQRDNYYVVERTGRLVGVCAAWDMGAFHRTTLLRYSRRGAALRALYGLARRVLPRAAPLPAMGQAFKTLTLTRVAIEGRDPAVLRALLIQIINDHVGCGYHMIHVGFAMEDPLRGAARGLLRQIFPSTLYYLAERGFEMPGREADPYVDLAMI